MASLFEDQTPVWRPKAMSKRQQCEEAIPAEWKLPQSVWDRLPSPLENHTVDLISMDIPRISGILTERELGITEKYSVQKLLAALASGEFTALEVTLAFSKRAAIAQQLTQCLTETMFEEAQDRARHLDSIKSKGELAGPLHGLPISIKDSFCVAGTQATLGLVSYLHDYSDTNATLVDILLELGAVIYVKTNVPQTLLTAECHNNVFGRALNPHNTALGPGGSSGGEGALIAFRGSLLGVGTDIGGSIRIPASCCGTYSFKPTTSRIPFGGQASCYDLGLRLVLPSAGPLAYDLQSLELFMQTVIGANPAAHDPTAIHAPWKPDNIQGKKQLRFGVVLEDPVFPLHPPVKKALAASVQLLSEAGHEIIELSPEEAGVNALTELLWAYFCLDTTGQRVTMEGGEPFVPSITSILAEVATLPWPLQEKHKDMQDIQKLSAYNILRDHFAQKWHGLWKYYRLDAVISPASRSTAVEHDHYAVPAYTMFLNVLDYPAAVLPVGKIPNKPDNTVFKARPGQPEYNHEILKGAPLSLQVFTNRMRDEECIAVAHVVDNCLEPLRTDKYEPKFIPKI